MPNGQRRIGIFVATMTGLADMCGEEIQGVLSGAGIDCERHEMDKVDPAAFAAFDTLIVVSSTYGHGEIPDNGLALFAALEAGIDLAGKDYALFALGDRTYADTFCAAGDRWDAVLQANGANRIIDVMRHDASSGTLAEDVAGEWAATWVHELA